MVATMKRKQPAEDTATKAAKRQKPDGKLSKKSDIEPVKENLKTVSVLAKEQPAFPRGGAGLLTPLERKQISARAARDVAAEAEKPRDLFTSTGGVSDDSDGDGVEEQDDSELRSAGKKKTKRRKTKEDSKKESTVSIEGLSFKRLAIESLILGCISSINAHDLTISLPNNLTGFVPLTSISRAFSDKLERSLQSQDDTQDGEDEDQSSIALEAHFRIGQYVRVAVTSLGEEAGAKTPSKKKIVLSLDPTQTNTGLTKSSLIAGCTVQAAVISVEDHGVVVDLGIKDGKETVKGFISAKALEQSTPLSKIQVGTVILSTVTSAGSNGKVVKLSADLAKGAQLKNAPSVDVFLPGTLVEVLVSDTTSDGIAGKLIGLIDATADLVHSGSYQDRETFADKYKIGQKLRARLICNFPLSETKKFGFSVLDRVLKTATDGTESDEGQAALAVSSIVSQAHVVRTAPGLGIYLSLPSGFGFAHISRLSDKKVESVSETTGLFKLGSEHKARILDFNAIDGLYILSLQKKVIEQPFLRVDDVVVGDNVKATIEKVLVGPAGVQGLIVNLAEGVTGMIPAIHLSDITLLHPEKKFKEGQTITARVLSVDLEKRQTRLTLKKTLINSDQRIWKTFDDIVAGESTIGTLVKIDPHGALVQFYGNVKGFLPVSEMSEAYIKDATEHFKIGQVLTVNSLSVNAAEERLTVSCRDRGASVDTSLASISPGTLVSGTVFEKSQTDLLLRLEASDVIARLALDHMSDGSEKKRRSALEKIRVGQKLENVLVLDVQRTGRLVLLCNRQSLIKSAQNGQLLKSWEDVKEDMTVTGYVSNITESGVFVRFAAGVNGLISKKHVPTAAVDQPDFNLTLLQAVTARITSVDYRGATPRFWLSMKQGTMEDSKHEVSEQKLIPETPQLVEPVDGAISSFLDYAVGRITKARITSIKETQLNVELAKDIQGRVDMSEIFDKFEDIKDRKQPLKIFNTKQVLTVRILGAHDTRNHRFLPLTHRAGKNTVFELSAKSSTINAPEVEPLSLSDMSVGSSWLGYVNNIVEDYLMVNISPTVRGRVRAIDVSDDLSLASDLDGNFPVGSAIRLQVRSVDLEKNHLDLTGKSDASGTSLTLQDISPGTILPGRITKVTDRSLLVQLADDLVGSVGLIDMADDYVQSNTALYQKNDVVRVCVVRVDVPNKKISLSTRPSKVLSSSLKVVDPEITSMKDLKVDGIVRGFISNVSDKGLFVALGHGITAFVRVTNLSDAFIKSWKDVYQRDQLVKGKVISIDETSGHVQLSLKESVITGTYKPPVTFTSVRVGDVVTGKVVKVEVFGVFILVDNSENVRGLCHRSEIAEQRVEDASKLFNQGDAVKAKVLKLDLPNRRINFGLKASYFVNDEDDDIDEDMEDADDIDAESDDSVTGGVDVDEILGDAEPFDSDNEESEQASDESSQEDEEDEKTAKKQPAGLSVGGFDWHGVLTDNTSLKRVADMDTKDSENKSKKKKRRSEPQVDLTGNLDTNGPQSTSDFERLLLGEPDSSLLWMQYMAFHLELGDTQAARSIGLRALNTIGLGQSEEKLNIWVALLNLENTYGDAESIDKTFRDALEKNDPKVIYNRLTSIYIQSGKHKEADNLLQEMLKKFTQDPKVYVNYASFLFDTMNAPERGRMQLTRALQVLPSFTHFDLTLKFALLEFKSESGLPERGRTIFEGLIQSFPKRTDLFDVLIDLEEKQGDKDAVRALYERIFERKLKQKKADSFFKKWEAFEKREGDDRQQEHVQAKKVTWERSQT